MNLILFQPAEIDRPLPSGAPRARHIREVLRRAPGDSFDVGLVNGPRGRAQLVSVDNDGLRLAFTWGAQPPPLPPLTLIFGLPRPQTARDLLRDATTMGVEAMHFVATEKGEPSYASSSLWQGGEWERLLVAGAQQAFDTRLPQVTFGQPLAAVLAALPAGGTRLALDNYEAARPLAECPISAGIPVVLALGAERGWSDAERRAMRAAGFLLAHLGPRVLRMETASVAAITLVKARFGWT